MAITQEEMCARLQRYIVRFPAHAGCWLWTGTQDEQGRPTIRLDTERRQLAMPLLTQCAGMESKWYKLLERRCSNPYCVNPEHYCYTPLIQSLINRLKLPK